MITPRFVLDTSEFDAGMAKQSGPAFHGRLVRAGESSGALLATEAKNLAPVGHSGVLRRGIGHEVVTRGGSVVTMVGSPSEHALVVHEGRRAGAKMAPAGTFLNWMSFKGIEHSREFAIRRANARKGMKARPFLRDALKKSQDRILRVYQAELMRG